MGYRRSNDGTELLSQLILAAIFIFWIGQKYKFIWVISGFIILALVLLIGFLLFRDYKKRKTVILPLRIPTSKIYETITSEISARHPLIQFSFPSQDQIYVKMRSIKNLVNKDKNIILEEAIEPVIEQACRDFSYATQQPWGTLTLPVAHLADSTFFENEPSFRVTENKKDPQDWDERRRIVFNRDSQQCQRCGVRLEIEQCHIHHIKQRANGGDHSLTNLVTLCRSCHPLMPNHGHMKEIVGYHTTGRTIHSFRCSIIKNGEQPSQKIHASLPDLLNRGYSVCKRCNPWKMHNSAQNWWKPDLVFFAKRRVKELVISTVGATSL